MLLVVEECFCFWIVELLELVLGDVDEVLDVGGGLGIFAGLADSEAELVVFLADGVELLAGDVALLLGELGRVSGEWLRRLRLCAWCR